MAKKYLLYIHNPEFEGEENKSAVVNGLLDDYYGKPEGLTGVLHTVVLDEDDYVDEKKTSIETLQAIIPEFRPCKHGAHPKFCKFAKPGKPCK